MEINRAVLVNRCCDWRHRVLQTGCAIEEHNVRTGGDLARGQGLLVRHKSSGTLGTEQEALVLGTLFSRRLP